MKLRSITLAMICALLAVIIVRKSLAQPPTMYNVITLAWSINNKIAVGYSRANDTVEIINATTGQAIAATTLRSVTDLDWEPNLTRERLAISTVRDGIYLWDIQSSQMTQYRFSPYDSKARWNADGSRLGIFTKTGTSGGDSYYLTIADPNSGTILHKLGLQYGRNAGLHDFAWHPSDPSLVAGLYKNTIDSDYGAIRAAVRIWNAVTGNLIYEMRLDDNIINITWNKDGSLLAVTKWRENEGAWIVLLDGQNYQPIKEIPVADMFNMAWSKVSSSQVAIGSSPINVYDVIAESVVYTITVSDAVNDIEWSPINNQFVTGGDFTPLQTNSVTYSTPTATPSLTFTPTFTPTPTRTLTPTATATIPPTNLVGMYEPFEYANITPALQPSFVIKNNGAQPLPLSEIRLRYYFTREGTSPLLAYCSFVPYVPLGPGEFPGEAPEPEACGSAVILETGAISPAVNGADSYVEMRFTAGTILPGAWAGRYILYIHKTDWSDFTQSSDYSFPVINPPFGLVTLGNWDKITLYRSTVRVWGNEPN